MMLLTALIGLVMYFYFHFDPQALAVESVLVSLIVAGHREEALVRIFVRASPGVMHAHRVVCRDRPVKKTPSLAACVLLSKLAEDLLDLPELQDRVFTGYKITVRDGLKHGWS